MPSRNALLVLDWWEKLAGASLALSAVIRLAQRLDLNLVAPSVQSSLFVPSAWNETNVSMRSWPLSAYYDVAALRRALAPQQLVDMATWRSLVSRAEASGVDNAARLLIVVYSDFPSSCRLPTQRRAAGDHACPSACLRLDGLRRLIAAASPHVGSWELSSQAVCARSLASS